MIYAGDEIYGDDITSGFDDDEPRRCRLCDGELGPNDFDLCRDCTGLRGCPDDICHGLGYCMHVWGDTAP